MFKWFNAIVQALRSWWHRRRRYTTFTGVVYMDSSIDPESALTSRKLVIIGTADKPKWLRFLCPCRCGETLALNLMPSHTPRWTVDLNKDQTITVYPSVDATQCRSHFWIRHNRVDWV